MAYSKTLETERLVLKLFDPTNPEHYTCQLNLVNSERIRALYNLPIIMTKEILDMRCALQKPTGEICTNLREGVEEPSHAIHLIFGKASGAFIGSISFMHRKGNGYPPDIGWGIHEEFWGKGYGKEAAGRVLRFWTEEIGVKDVWAVTGRTNWASRKICEKIGLEEAGDFTMFLPDGSLAKVVAYMLPGMERLEPGQELNMNLQVGMPGMPPKN